MKQIEMMIAAAAVDGVHVVDECLHCLVYAAHGAVDGVVKDTLLAGETGELCGEVILDLSVVEIGIVFAVELLEVLNLLDIGRAYVGRHIEVERGDGLTAVHLVLCRLHGYATHDAGRLDALGRTALSVTGTEATLQDVIQGVLHAGERLGGIVVLVVDMDISVLDGIAHVFREKACIHVRLRGL